jgi:serine kinase of HPr protein (carbohydrate metabolism regulator)
VLLLGEPGAGKSDLALRLIDRGAKLVADDQVELTRKGDTIIASAPKSITGLIEVRGAGIFKMPIRKSVPVLLAVYLAKQEWIERLPYPSPYECLGTPIPELRICAFEPSAAIKVEMAAAALQDGSMTVGAFKE